MYFILKFKPNIKQYYIRKYPSEWDSSEPDYNYSFANGLKGLSAAVGYNARLQNKTWNDFYGG